MAIMMADDRLVSLRDYFGPVITATQRKHPDIRIYLEINYRLDSLILGAFSERASYQAPLISVDEFKQTGWPDLVQSRLDAVIKRVLPSPGESEYEEIMQAQEAMEEINGSIHQG